MCCHLFGEHLTISKYFFYVLAVSFLEIYLTTIPAQEQKSAY